MGCDAIVAGAGLWGCTVARRLAEAGQKILVLEKRKAVGGNCRCRTEKGIEVHLYGSHIFHTSNEEVWKFVNRFVTFNDYRHEVLANHTGRIYHLPIGKMLLQEFFGVDMRERNLKEFLSQPSTFNPQPSTSNRTNGDDLFDAFIRGYTSKQWGVAPEEVDPSVIARLKVRDTYSTDYFDDPHQGIPVEGYNELFRRLLDHPNIRVRCGTQFELRSPSDLNCPVYYSGPVDRLFGYRFGHLPWRTLRFETEHLPRRDFQGATVVNYPDVSVPYTRIHEFKHYHPEAKGAFAKPQGTIITREYSDAWRLGDEPYYPIDNESSRALLAKYREEVETVNRQCEATGGRLVVGGRLGEYRYYDMDKSIAAALALPL